MKTIELIEVKIKIYFNDTTIHSIQIYTLKDNNFIKKEQINIFYWINIF